MNCDFENMSLMTNILLSFFLTLWFQWYQNPPTRCDCEIWPLYHKQVCLFWNSFRAKWEQFWTSYRLQESSYCWFCGSYISNISTGLWGSTCLHVLVGYAGISQWHRNVPAVVCPARFGGARRPVAEEIDACIRFVDHEILFYFVKRVNISKLIFMYLQQEV